MFQLNVLVPFMLWTPEQTPSKHGPPSGTLTIKTFDPQRSLNELKYITNNIHISNLFYFNTHSLLRTRWKTLKDPCGVPDPSLGTSLSER